MMMGHQEDLVKKTMVNKISQATVVSGTSLRERGKVAFPTAKKDQLGTVWNSKRAMQIKEIEGDLTLMRQIQKAST